MNNHRAKITSIKLDYNPLFNEFIINDFINDIDSIDYLLENDEKFKFENPEISINTITFDDKLTKTSSFTIKESNEEVNWTEYKVLDIGSCAVLIVSELAKQNIEKFDEWLSSCYTNNQTNVLYKDGALYIESGFGPGEYALMVSYNNDKINGIRMEFIKEHIENE